MSMIGTSTSAVVYASRREMVAARIAAYAELCKPRIAALVLVVVAVSAFVASGAAPSIWVLIHTLAGTALVAASASTFNQVLERRSDARMDRTADRPLPGGRLAMPEAIYFGAATFVVGVAYLGATINLLTALFGALTWLLYVAVYTPLKARTSANTAVGAVAGALPVLIGWAAVDGSFAIAPDDPGTELVPGGVLAAALFLIVYLWQFPHFMAIAWLYRRQYAAAGLRMLTVVDATGRRAGAQAVLGALALIPVSLVPALQLSARAYLAGAISLGVAYLVAAGVFCWRRDERSARALLHASLIYLPGLLLLLVLPLL